MGANTFQSTPPTRRATFIDKPVETTIIVSIHAPHTEGDGQDARLYQFRGVSIHAPHTEGDV